MAIKGSFASVGVHVSQARDILVVLRLHRPWTPPRLSKYAPARVSPPTVIGIHPSLNPLSPAASQQSNEPLTPKQIAVVLENISSRRKDLQYIDKVIQEEELKSAANAAAIAHLEPAITRAKLAIAAQRDVLAELIKMKTKLDEVSGAAGPNWADTSEAKALCEDAMDRVDCQVKHGLEKFNGQISQFERNIPTLCTSLHDMELEIYSQRLMRDASTQHITNLGAHKNSTKKNIELLRFGVNPIKNTPAEIWAKIFAIRVNEDMETYFANPGNQLIPPITLRLSQVCRFWRRVVCSERILWRFVAIYPDSLWLPSKVELLKYSRSFHSGVPSLVHNLTQATTWTGTTASYDPWGRYNYTPTRSAITISASEISMLNAYSLRLLAYGHDNGVYSSSMSFRQPKSLTLQFISTPNTQWFTTLLGPLSGFTSLEIITQADYASAAQQLSTTHPQLTYLKLDLTTLQPFDISGYLGPKLTEFHLTHNGTNALTQSTATIRLPKLKVLGITPPDTDFVQWLECPKLSKLIMYGPKVSDLAPVSLARLADLPPFTKVRDVELHGWSLFKPSGGEEWNVMVPLNEIVEKMRSIVTLKCVDSYIDGSRLVGFVDTLKDTTANVEGSILETVVVDRCSGITRDDCETVAAMVGKMEVYV